jgi:hypothetical protein
VKNIISPSCERALIAYHTDKNAWVHALLQSERGVAQLLEPFLTNPEKATKIWAKGYHQLAETLPLRVHALDKKREL